MKYSTVVLFLLAGYSSAGSPELSITLKDGSYGSVKSATAPTLKFSGESDGFAYGGSVDLASDGLPKSIWGQTSAKTGGWTVKTRAEVSQGKYDFKGEDTGVYLTLEGNTDDGETYVWGSGVVAKGDVQALKVGGKKIIPLDAGKLMIAPRYEAEGNAAHVCLGFENDDTKAYLTLSENDKNLLIKQKINGDNSATVKTGTTGFIAATLTNESDLGSTTVKFTPEDIDVELKKDGWVAGIKSAKSLDSEPTVRFSKSLTFGM